jgi:methylenetetrahydrofolate reductase (NADPH)
MIEGLKKQDPSLQLNMSFKRDNRLAQAMHQGRFAVLLEYDTPLQDQPLDSALARGKVLAEKAGGTELITGMAVTDRFRSEKTHDPVKVAAALAEISGKPLLLHLSGKGSSPQRTRELLAEAESHGIRTLLAVTGDRSDQHSDHRRYGRIPPYAAGYSDSITTLGLIKDRKREFFAGAAVNPFKYTLADQYLQYYKMVRKIGCGAEFIVAQAGWDMKKLQELQWYLQMREIGTPVLARIILLSLEKIQSIHQGIYPGVNVSRSLGALLQRESSLNATQSMAAQLQRIGLQVAGCKFMGYNGVQLAGIPDASTLKMVTNQISESLERYQTYAEWLAAWHNYHGTMSFAPVAEPYYVFTNLLTPTQQMYDPDACPLTETQFEMPSKHDLIRSQLTNAVLSPHLPEAVKHFGEKLLQTRYGTPHPALLPFGYFGRSDCPKQLVFGACGGSAADGTCEFGHAPCFFRRILALAAHERQLDLLEGEPPRVRG